MRVGSHSAYGSLINCRFGCKSRTRAQLPKVDVSTVNAVVRPYNAAVTHSRAQVQ
jgi:hypothetical protein